MLLDAVLTNAIRNIKSDKTISKLTSLSSIKKFRNPRSKNSSIDDGRRNSVKTNNKTEKDYNDILKDEEKNRDLIEYLSEVFTCSWFLYVSMVYDSAVMDSQDFFVLSSR